MIMISLKAGESERIMGIYWSDRNDFESGKQTNNKQGDYKGPPTELKSQLNFVQAQNMFL